MTRPDLVRFLGIFLFVSFAHQPAVAGEVPTVAQAKSETESWLSADDERRDPGAEVYIQRARVFMVPAATRQEAVSVLENASIVPLSSEEVDHFLSRKSPTGDEVLKSAIADADDEAKSVGSFGVPSADMSIAYARTLYGKLRPYLVRAVIPNDGGTFSISLAGETLTVFSGSLGNIDYKRRPIVIFLERRPARVLIAAMSAL